MCDIVHSIVNVLKTIFLLRVCIYTNADWRYQHQAVWDTPRDASDTLRDASDTPRDAINRPLTAIAAGGDASDEHRDAIAAVGDASDTPRDAINELRDASDSLFLDSRTKFLGSHHTKCFWTKQKLGFRSRTCSFP
jgi:hypothetical protein